jgi:hypothetical protein
MGFVTCTGSRLTDLGVDVDLAGFASFVNPIDYEFSVHPGTEYVVLGFERRRGTLWLFVAPSVKGGELDLVPALLFSPGSEAQEGRLAFGNDEETLIFGLDAITPALRKEERWYELYLEDDPRINALVAAEIEIARNRRMARTWRAV